MNKIKQSIQEIADIIGYSGNKEELYNQLMNICYLNAVDNLIEKSSSESRQSIRNEMSNTSSLQQMGEIINKYFNEQQVNEALQESFKVVFGEYVETIKNSLTEEQVNKLNDFSTALNSQLNQ
jgi:hypothetical protein